MANGNIALYSVAVAQGFIFVLIMFFYLLKVKNRYSNGGTLPAVLYQYAGVTLAVLMKRKIPHWETLYTTGSSGLLW